MTTTVLILCGGNSLRWNNYLGIKKHFIRIEGETLLERTCRLVKKYKTDKTNIYVVGSGRQYEVKGTRLYMPDYNPDFFEADKYLSSRKLWNKKGRTVVLLGDVWFSDEAISKIMRFGEQKWCAFGRKGPSIYTDHPYRELFAQIFWNHHIPKHYSKLIELGRLYKKGITKKSSGWAHYNLMVDNRINSRYVTSNFVNIDDFTDDFDFGKDYDSWIKNRKNHKKYEGISLQIWNLKKMVYCHAFHVPKHRLRIIMKILCDIMPNYRPTHTFKNT